MIAGAPSARAQEGFTCAPTYLSSYSWQSNSGTTSETHNGTGLYTISFGSLSSTNGGNAMVTAFGPITGATSNRCNLDSWGVSGSNVQVNLRCYNSSGTLTDNDHNVSFVRSGFLGGSKGAYLWYNLYNMSGNPNATWSYNSSGGTNYISRSGTGDYIVELPGVWDSSSVGAVHVAAHDDGASSSGKYCKIGDWAKSGTSDVWVYVKCYDHSGTAADSRFSLAYSIVAPIAGLSGAWALANDETNTVGYNPTKQRDYFDNCNSPSDSGTISAKKTATGQYTVTIPNLSSFATGITSHVQVTAWDKDTMGTNTNYCNVQTWSGNSPVTVKVNCFNTSGSAADTKFVISFTNDDSGCVGLGPQ